MGVRRVRTIVVFVGLSLAAAGCRNDNPVIEGPVPTTAVTQTAVSEVTAPPAGTDTTPTTVPSPSLQP